MKAGHDMEHSSGKLDKRITEYFDFKYRVDDFAISGMVLSADIDVVTHEDVLAYLKVLHRIGKVKGFSPVAYDCFGDSESFCLDGNSSGIRFQIYDLESLLEHQLQKIDMNKKMIKSVVKECSWRNRKRSGFIQIQLMYQDR